MRHAVERSLYTDIHISPSDQSRCFHKLLRTLVDRPDLAGQVTSFRGCLSELPPERKPSILSMEWKPGGKIPPPMENLLSQALNLMTNLRSLTLTSLELDESSDRVLRTIVAPNLAGRLTSLKIGDPVFKGNFISWSDLRSLATAQTLALISLQPNLHTLALTFLEEFSNVEITSLEGYLPNLTSLTCSSKAAKKLVPSRPITSLKLLDLPSNLKVNIPDAWESIASSTGPLIDLFLVVTHSNDLAENLRCVAERIPLLENLRLAGIRNRDHAVVRKFEIYAPNPPESLLFSWC